MLSTAANGADNVCGSVPGRALWERDPCALENRASAVELGEWCRAQEPRAIGTGVARVTPAWVVTQAGLLWTGAWIAGFECHLCPGRAA